MRSLLTLLVPAIALSLGAFACSGSDSADIDDSTETQTSQLVDEGRECSIEKKCKPGLACVARVKGGDVGIKGVPAPCSDKDCGESSSSSSSTGGSTTSSSGNTSGWSSSTGGVGSTSSTSGWTSSTSSTGGVGSTSSTSGWTSSSTSSTGGAPEVGVCITVR